MLLFLASVLEQLDLALEHLSKRDVHNARFGLMLIDNAVELVLHQIVKDKASCLKYISYRKEKYPHQAALKKALGKSFDDKVNFARLNNSIDEQCARTIKIMHEFRNEVYHIGIQHEDILQNISEFYFDIACKSLKNYEPMILGWGSNQKLPERARKYFNNDSFFPGKVEDFENGCIELAKMCNHNAETTIIALADHLDWVIDDQDTCIDIVSDGIYSRQKITRDRAVIKIQAWPLAFSEAGKEFATQHGWTGNMRNLVEWISDNYPFKFRTDPIPSWQKQAAKLRMQKNAHAALAHYNSFMTETVSLREMLSESARQIEDEINS